MDVHQVISAPFVLPLDVSLDQRISQFLLLFGLFRWLRVLLSGKVSHIAEMIIPTGLSRVPDLMFVTEMRVELALMEVSNQIVRQRTTSVFLDPNSLIQSDELFSLLVVQAHLLGMRVKLPLEFLLQKTQVLADALM